MRDTLLGKPVVTILRDVWDPRDRNSPPVPEWIIRQAIEWRAKRDRREGQKLISRVTF